MAKVPHTNAATPKTDNRNNMRVVPNNASNMNRVPTGNGSTSARVPNNTVNGRPIGNG